MIAINKKMKKYNGWTNYETWNVNLFITNEEGYYRTMIDILKKGVSYHGDSPYEMFVIELSLSKEKTIDGVYFMDDLVNRKEINEHLLGWEGVHCDN